MRTFTIAIQMRTPDGFRCIGRFDLGEDRSFAYELFGGLQGDDLVTDSDILHIDLVEEDNGLPVNFRVMSCTADELSANCRCVVKALFQRFSLHQRG